jgi:hypothetical protein
MAEQTAWQLDKRRGGSYKTWNFIGKLQPGLYEYRQSAGKQ